MEAKILQAFINALSAPELKFLLDLINVRMSQMTEQTLQMTEQEVQLCKENYRLKAIKSVRVRLNLGLREAKDLVDRQVKPVQF